MKLWKRIRRLAGPAAVLTAAWLLGKGLPREFWAALGEKAALAAVGWQQPEGTAALISRRLERIPAGAPGEAAPLPVWRETEGAEQQPAPEVAPAGEEPPVSPPPENGTGGKIVTQRVGGGSEIAGIRVKNKGGAAAAEALPEAVSGPLPFALDFGSPEPQVLIYHTHTTEGYMSYDAGYYNEGDVPRTPEYPYSVILAGDALTAELEAAGIRVIHDTAVHDYPSYRGAYDRSLARAREILQQYPSIRITVDLHRDGLMAGTKDMLKPTATVNGEKAAQMMIVCSVASTKSNPHPEWRKNLSLAAHLQQRLEQSAPGLMRPLSLTSARYNQHLTAGSLLVEVGSEGNTWQEAVTSARLLARAIIDVFSP